MPTLNSSVGDQVCNSCILLEQCYKRFNYIWINFVYGTFNSIFRLLWV